MNSFKKVLLTILIISLSNPMISCEGREIIKKPILELKTLSGVLDTDKTLTNNKIWLIERRFIIPKGKTLTIKAGTIIKGKEGSGADASVLIVARGGKIMAEGTKEKPIIFTSIKDNIKVGQKFGSNLDQSINGLWGGVIILGRAKGSFENDVTEIQIEGIPASDTNGLYGGDVDNDNSGVFKYISIRHGGSEIGEGNEINGLTLGCVGSGTVVENIEVVGNKDDGIEFFGGSVNVSNLLVYSCGDDGLDIDQAYKGMIRNSMVILGNNSDHALEVDGSEGSLTGSFMMDNITLIGNQTTTKGEYADFREAARGEVKNVYARGFKADSDIELDDNGSSTNYTNKDLVFGIWQVVLPSGVTNASSLFNNKSSVAVTGFGSTAQAIIEGGQTVGANEADFSWTFAKHKNAF